MWPYRRGLVAGYGWANEAAGVRGARPAVQEGPMRTTDLPEAIVAPLQELARALSAWADAHPDEPLAGLEQRVLDGLRAVAPALLAGLVQQTQRGLQPRFRRGQARCPGCGGAGRVQSWRWRQLRTRCGDVGWTRPRLVCTACGHGYSPVDQTLGLAPHDRFSAGLRDLVVRLGSAGTFAEAAELLDRATGIAVGKETVRGLTLAAGQALRAAEDARVAATAQTGQSSGPVEPAPGQLVVETDGVLLRYLDGWHEVKLGLIGGWCVAAGQQGRGRLRAVSYVAAREPAAAFGARWGAEAARRGAWAVEGWTGRASSLAVLRRAVVLGDGARWIWETAREQFGDRVEIVDVFHATEHLGAVAKAVFGEATPDARGWLEATRTALLASGPDAVLAALRALPLTTDAQRAVVRRERGYFSANQHRMQYPAFRAAGLPIGSGAVESSAKHLAQQRLKRAGMRWSVAGADALLALRAQRATELSSAA
jgi:hypothetical protein